MNVGRAQREVGHEHRRLRRMRLDRARDLLADADMPARRMDDDVERLVLRRLADRGQRILEIGDVEVTALHVLAVDDGDHARAALGLEPRDNLARAGRRTRQHDVAGERRHRARARRRVEVERPAFVVKRSRDCPRWRWKPPRGRKRPCGLTPARGLRRGRRIEPRHERRIELCRVLGERFFGAELALPLSALRTCAFAPRFDRACEKKEQKRRQQTRARDRIAPGLGRHERLRIGPQLARTRSDQRKNAPNVHWSTVPSYRLRATCPNARQPTTLIHRRCASR